MEKKLIIFMPSIEGGGVEKNFFIISNYLADKIKNVTLITADQKFNKKFNKIKIINPKKIFNRDHGRIIKYLYCLIELIKILLKNNKNLVLSFQANLYCIIISKILGSNIIIRANSSPSGWAKNLFKRKIFTIILKFANSIIVNSQDLKVEFKNKFSVSAKCIYNPLDKKNIIKKSKENINFSFFKKNTLKIITVGRLVDQKDHLTLLKALKIVKGKLRFSALVIGSGIKDKILKKFIINNNLKKEIKIIKFQKNPYKYLKLADIFILSSKFEGLPNVLLEALSLKKFVISSDCLTGPREILDSGKGGILFDKGNYKDLSKKIIYFYNNYNKNIIKKKKAYGYKRLFRFDYKLNLNKYLKLVIIHLNK